MDEGDDVQTSSGSDYITEESADGGGSGNSVSLESELEFAKDVGGGNETKGEEASRRRGKQVSHVSKLEVL